MELMLASGTLKNLMFLLKSRLSTDRVSVMKLNCSTFQSWHCITVIIELLREAYWFSTVLLDLTRYRSQTWNLQRWGIYMPHMHWVDRGTGIPKDRDEVNRREVCECDGWVWFTYDV
jgi:hypothetical protein